MKEQKMLTTTIRIPADDLKQLERVLKLKDMNKAQFFRKCVRDELGRK